MDRCVFQLDLHAMPPIYGNIIKHIEAHQLTSMHDITHTHTAFNISALLPTDFGLVISKQPTRTQYLDLTREVIVEAELGAPHSRNGNSHFFLCFFQQLLQGVSWASKSTRHHQGCRQLQNILVPTLWDKLCFTEPFNNFPRAKPCYSTPGGSRLAAAVAWISLKLHSSPGLLEADSWRNLRLHPW